MKSELNIFELKQNQTALLDLRGVLAAPSGDRQNYIDVWLHGELSVTESKDIGGERVVKGNMKVLASFDVQAGGDTVKNGTVVNFNVEARLKKNEDGHSVALILKHNQLPRGFVIHMGLRDGGPLNVYTEVSFFDEEQDINEPLMSSDLLANPSVAEAGNPWHVKAVSGIQTIAATTAPSFIPNATALLFPPPPPPTEELVVRGTLDWVMFHRRRTRQCGIEAQPAPTVVRRYNVYQLPFRQDILDKIPEPVEFIHSKFPTFTPAHLNKHFFPAGQVEFGGGTSTINDPNSFLTAWEASKHEDVLFYGGILSTGDALQDGDTLALARLANVRQVLVGKIPVHAQAQFDILPAAPPFLAQPGVDGVILLGTTAAAQVQTVCHSVYHAQNFDDLKSMELLIKQGAIEAALKRATLLGVVNFNSGTPNGPELVSVGKVRDAWNSIENKPPSRVLVVSPLDDIATADTNKVQMEAIMLALGANDTSKSATVGGKAPLPGECPAISIFANESD